MISNHHLLMAEERRAGGSGRASPDASEGLRRMSITQDTAAAWNGAATSHAQQAAAAAAAASNPQVAALAPLLHHEWKHVPALTVDTAAPSTPIALTYHLSPAVAASVSTSSPVALSSPRESTPQPGHRHIRNHSTQSTMYHTSASTAEGAAYTSMLKRSTLPLHISFASARDQGHESMPRAISAPGQVGLPPMQQTPHLTHSYAGQSASTSHAQAVAQHQLPLQLLNQSTGSYSHTSMLPVMQPTTTTHIGFPPNLSRDGSIDVFSGSDISAGSSVAGSSRSSPSRGYVGSTHYLGANHSLSASMLAVNSGSSSSAISKCPSQTQLFMSRDQTPEPGAVGNHAQTQHSQQTSGRISEESASPARESLPSAGQAPGSMDSRGSVGSLNAAVEQLTVPSSLLDSPNVAAIHELSTALTLYRATSTSSTSSTSSSSRNANNKRTRDGEEEATVATAQQKTSAATAASSTQATAQAAAAAAPTPTPAATAAASSSSAAAAAAPAAASSSSAAAGAAAAPAASPTSLAPYTPKRAALISVLSCVLSQLFSNPNDTLPSDPRLLTRFHTERLPGISIGEYLQRIAHYSECSDEALVMSFIHISRITHNKPGFNLNALSIHRLLLTSIMTTVKFHDDFYFNNAFYSKIGGVGLREMNHLEIDFLELIQFELYIDSRVYVRFYDELKNSVLHPNCTCSYQNMVELDLDEIEHPPQI